MCRFFSSSPLKREKKKKKKKAEGKKLEAITVNAVISAPRTKHMDSKRHFPIKSNEGFLGKWLVPDWRHGYKYDPGTQYSREREKGTAENTGITSKGLRSQQCDPSTGQSWTM